MELVHINLNGDAQELRVEFRQTVQVSFFDILGAPEAIVVPKQYFEGVISPQI